MRGLVRMLIMFAPMLIRQFEKYQRNKARRLPKQSSEPYPARESQSSRRQEHHSRQNEHRDINLEIKTTKRKELSVEERNFKLKEEDIMLDKEDLRYLKEDTQTEKLNSLDLEEQMEELEQMGIEEPDQNGNEELKKRHIEELPPEKKNESNLDLEDLQDLFDTE